MYDMLVLAGALGAGLALRAWWRKRQIPFHPFWIWVGIFLAAVVYSVATQR